MKKYIFAGLMAATCTFPAFAADSKFIAASPDAPVHRRTLLLTIAALMLVSASPMRLPKKPEPATPPSEH